MGTFVAITAIHSSRDEAENAIGLAFEEIDRLSGCFKPLRCKFSSCKAQ